MASYSPEEKKLVLFLVVTAAVIHIIVVVVCSCSSCCFCKCCRYTDCALPPECPQVPVGLPGKVGTVAQVLVYSATIPSLGRGCHYPSPHYQQSATLLWPQHGHHGVICSTLLAPPSKSAGTQVQRPSFSRAGLTECLARANLTVYPANNVVFIPDICHDGVCVKKNCPV